MRMPDPRSKPFFIVVAALCLFVLAIASCKSEKPAGDTSGTTATSTTTTPTGGGSFNPVSLPNPEIPGFAFPEPEPNPLLPPWFQTARRACRHSPIEGAVECTQERDECRRGSLLTVTSRSSGSSLSRPTGDASTRCPLRIR